jgi:hypothetical protein
MIDDGVVWGGLLYLEVVWVLSGIVTIFVLGKAVKSKRQDSMRRQYMIVIGGALLLGAIWTVLNRR